MVNIVNIMVILSASHIIPKINHLPHGSNIERLSHPHGDLMLSNIYNHLQLSLFDKISVSIYFTV